MIPSAAIKQYMREAREDHRWLKKLSHAELDKLLDGLKPRPHFWHKLGLHQKVVLYLGIKYRVLALWLDMGTGKSLASLELLQYWWDAGLMRRALIFVVSDKAFSTWERQAREYKITVPVTALDASSSDRKWDILDRSGEGIVLLTYPGAVAMASERVKRKGKVRWQLSKPALRDLLRGVDAVVLDESTKCSNTGSLTYKLCREASYAAEFRYALAGMPFGRDPTPLWAQMFLVDHGETLGPTLGLFRKAFFTEKDSYWGGPHTKEYTFKPKLKDTLSRFLQHRSITYTADECIDLPAVRWILSDMKLPEDTRAYYDQVVSEVISARGNLRAMKNALHRMRQLSSGFLGLKDDETGERAELEFQFNPKLERLLELLEEMPPERKALIFYDYTFSGRLITQRLKEAKQKSIWLWSGTKNSKKEIDRFMTDPLTRFAVVNNRVGAYSLDGLQVANYEYHYETAISVIDRAQAEKRIVRQGQTRKCFIYDLVVRDTFDGKILQFHKDGEALFDALLRNPQQFLELDKPKPSR